MARAVLTLTAAGTPVPEVLVDELARSVLCSAVVELARQVEDGGPHRLRRAVDLAELVLAELQAAQRMVDGEGARHA